MHSHIFSQLHRIGHDGSLRYIDIGGITHGDIRGIMHSHIFSQLHCVGYNGGLGHINIGGIMHSHIFRQLHRVGYDSSLRHINIGGIMHSHIFYQLHRVSYNCSLGHVNIGCVMHSHIFRQLHRVGHDGSLRHVYIGGVMHRNIFRQGHRVGHNGGVVHGIWHILVGRVMHSDKNGIMHMHRVDTGSSQSGGRFSYRCGCRGRQILAFGELPAERQPHGVAGMQGMNVHMGDGVEVRHLIGFSNRVDRLTFLNDVHIVPATVQHLCLKTHFDRRSAGLLGPC